MNKSNTISRLLYWIGLVLMVFFMNVIVSSSLIDEHTVVANAVKYLSIFSLFAALIFKEKWTARQCAFLICLFALSLCVILFASSNRILLFIMCVVAAAGISPKKLCRNLIIFNAICVSIVMLSAFVGIIPNNTYLRFGRTVYSFGYYYYSWLAYICLFFTISGYYLINGKYSKGKELLFIMVSLGLNIIVYYLTGTRLQIYSYIIFVVLSLLYGSFKFNKRRKKIRMILATIMFPLGAVLSILTSYYFKNIPSLGTLDIILNYRLTLGWMAFQRYPINAFGNAIVTAEHTATQEYFYLDNGYLYGLLSYGVIVFIATILMYTIISRYAVRTNDYKLFSWCIIVCVFSLVNDVLIRPDINALLLFSSCAVVNERRKSKSNANLKLNLIKVRSGYSRS